MNSDARIPADLSAATKSLSWAGAPAMSSPPSVVSSCRRSGTRQAACGRCFCAMASIASVAAISRLSGTVSSRDSRAMSSSEMCRRSSRRWAVMRSAPAATASLAARTGSGCRLPRAWRMVATWSMLTPRRRGRFSIIALSAPRALDRIDHRRRAQRRNDIREVTDVLHFDIDQDLEEIERPVGDFEVGDVAATLADDSGQAAEAARLVAERDADAAEMGAIGIAVVAPGDVEPALRRFGKGIQRLAIDGVDRDALARCDDADDAVAGQRMAAAGEMQRHAGNEAADRHRVLGCLLAPGARSKRHHFRRLLGLNREDGVHDLAAGMHALADRDHEILARRAVESAQHFVQRLLGGFVAFLAERLLQDRLAASEILVALLRADEAPDAGARLAGDDEPLPGRRRGLRLGGYDIDLVAVGENRPQRHQPPVDLGADAGIADLAVHGIGEIDGGGTARQLDQIALRREAEDLILVHFELGVLEEFLRIGRVLDDVEALAQPAILAAVGIRRALLVDPMRGDAELGHLVHLGGADLYLNALAFRTYESC